MIARVLLEHDQLEHGRLGKDALGDGALGRGWFDGGHDVGREEAAAIGEAVERLDRIDDAALAVVLQGFLLAALVRGLQFVEAIAEVQGVLQRDGGQRLFDEVAEELDISLVGPLRVGAFLEANPQLDQFVLGGALRHDGEITMHLRFLLSLYECGPHAGFWRCAFARQSSR